MMSLTDETPASALAAARENEARHRAALEAAEGALAAARTKRETLVAAAGAGNAIAPADLTGAEDDLRTAAGARDIASAVHAAAIERREVAEIAAWHEQALDLENRIEAVITERIAIAKRADEVADALRLVLERFNKTCGEFMAARHAAAAWNGGALGRAAANKTLGTLHSGEHPRARLPKQPYLAAQRLTFAPLVAHVALEVGRPDLAR